jgi:hypothetical protein
MQHSALPNSQVRDVIRSQTKTRHIKIPRFRTPPPPPPFFLCVSYTVVWPAQPTEGNSDAAACKRDRELELGDMVPGDKVCRIGRARRQHLVRTGNYNMARYESG